MGDGDGDGDVGGIWICGDSDGIKTRLHYERQPIWLFIVKDAINKTFLAPPKRY